MRKFALFLLAYPALATLSVSVISAPTSVGQYDMWELRLSHSGSYATDDDVTVTATFTAPAGASPSSYTVHGFRYASTEWRVRFACRNTGSWGWSVTMDNGSDTYSTSGSFTCTATSNKGFLKPHPSNPQYQFATEDGSNAYLLGVQGTWETFWLGGPPEQDPVSADTYFSTLAAAGFNTYRNNGESPKSYLTGSGGTFNVSSSGKNIYTAATGPIMDTVVSTAHQYGFHVIFDPMQGGDPVNYTPAYNLTSDPTKTAAMYKVLDYAIARWGWAVDMWELANEKGSGQGMTDTWLSTVASYVKSVEPYGHMVTVSFPPEPSFTSSQAVISNNQPHQYFDTSDLLVDYELVFGSFKIDYWRGRFPNVPLYWGETGQSHKSPNWICNDGSQDPANVANPQPASPYRFRTMLWTNFTNRAAGLVFWDESFHVKCTGGLVNQYIGNTERQASTFWRSFVDTFPALSNSLTVTVNSGSQSVRKYALTSSSDVAVYIVHSNSHSTSVTGATLTLTYPATMTGTWYNPQTGATLGTVASQNAGSHTLGIPTFTEDVVLRLSTGGGGGGTAPTITSTSPLQGGTVGVDYSQTLTATGTGTITWSVVSGSPPPNISLSGAGVLSGTPTNAGTFTFTVQAANGITPDATKDFIITIDTAPVAPIITSTDPLPGGTVGTLYSQPLTATGDTPTTPVAWSLISGSLPSGLSLSSGGVISGTPTLANTYTFTVQASNGVSPDATKSLSITIAATGGSSSVGPVTVVEVTGSTQTNRVIRVSRVFKQGDIPGGQYPQPLIGGSAPASWQSDVKNAWPDGSVKHAIITFISTLTANSSTVVAFTPSSNACHLGSISACQAAALDQSGMLSFASGAWDFQADFTANGVTKSANARTVLNGGSWRYWLRGPVVTEAIVEDRSTALAYDFGWHWDGTTMINDAASQYQSLHPYFVLTFNSGLNAVKGQFIAENTWTEKRQDQKYDLSLKVGSPLVQVYSKTAFTHIWASRWRKTFWSGTGPGNIKIDFNMPYMISSKLLPNYDLTKTVTSADVASENTTFQSTDKGDLGGNAQEQKDFIPADEGNILQREEIRLLYAMSSSTHSDFGTMWDIAFGCNMAATSGSVNGCGGNTEAYPHIPIHMRESNTGLVGFWDSDANGTADTGTAFGRVVSVDARTTLRTKRGNEAGLPVAVGTSTLDGWSPDVAHQHDRQWIAYVLTGDYYFLEEMDFWSAYDIGISGSGSAFYERHGNWGVISDGEQTRGLAWGYNQIGNAAFMHPTGDVETSYFTQKLENNLAVKEGRFEQRNGNFFQACSSCTLSGTGWSGTCPGYNANTETSKWCWGRFTQGRGFSNPLGFVSYIGRGTDGASQTFVDSSKVSDTDPPWHEHMVIESLGHLAELGFKTGKLMEAMAPHWISQIEDPTYDPYLIEIYAAPITHIQTGTYAQTWAEHRSLFTTASPNGCAPNNCQNKAVWYWNIDPNNAYAFHAIAAMSFLTGYDVPSLACTPNCGQAAYDWLKASITNQSAMNGNPKLAILPRAASIPPPTRKPSRARSRASFFGGIKIR